MGSLEGAANRELQGTGAPQEAPGPEPSSVSLESLAENVSNPGFQKAIKTPCGAARRRARKAKLAGPPGGGPAGGDARPPRGGQLQQGGMTLPSGGGGQELRVGPASGAPSSSTTGDGGNRLVQVSAKSQLGNPGDRQAEAQTDLADELCHGRPGGPPGGHCV
jgi:hypothetical protein